MDDAGGGGDGGGDGGDVVVEIRLLWPFPVAGQTLQMLLDSLKQLVSREETV